jgi:hypothetical protein
VEFSIEERDLLFAALFELRTTYAEDTELGEALDGDPDAVLFGAS